MSETPTPTQNSLASSVAALPSDQQKKLLTDLSEEELKALDWDWRFWARPNQLPPALSQSGGEWLTWILLAGRGFGKSRTGAEWVRGLVERGEASRICLIAPTSADVRDVMVEGESGLLNVCPPWNRPKWEPSKRRLTWPNGAIATTFSAEEPERLRGPQHDALWADELAAWRYPETWDMAQMGLRLGRTPKAVVTTTPKPVKLVRRILSDPATAITRGSTYDNAANLAETFLHSIQQTYEGTRLGRQEIYAEVLEDVEGALWTRDMIDDKRWAKNTPLPPMRRIVVSIDPAVSSSSDSDETGIIVCGTDPGLEGAGVRGFVLDDLSCRASPEKWARIAVNAYYRWQADRIVAEVNNGGDLVEATIRTVDPNVAFKAVRASKGKFTRAEPVASLYEQGRVCHAEWFKKLEDQMTQFTSDMDRRAYGSPDRVDALVWGLTELIVENQLTGLIDHYRKEYESNLRDRESRFMAESTDGVA